MSDAALLRVEVRGHTLVMTMQRAAKRNAVNRELGEAIDAALARLEDDPVLRVGILAADGPAFCAGSDLSADGGQVAGRRGIDSIVTRVRTKPLIAAVAGPAVGGGFEIVLACDLVVATDEARFGFPEVTRGLVPACGGLFRGPRALPLNVACELILTGETMDARRGYDVGLVNVLAERGEAVAAALRLAERIAGNGPAAVRACLTAIEELTSGARDWAVTERAKAAVAGSADRSEGIAAFRERRDPVWTDR